VCGTFSFPRSHRLRSRRDFSRVFEMRVRAADGPLIVFASPTDLSHCRLGIVIGRPVGCAVRRNRIKRCLREAFRLNQASLTGRYDFVAVVRPHDPAVQMPWGRMLLGLMRTLDARWQRRQADGNSTGT